MREAVLAWRRSKMAGSWSLKLSPFSERFSSFSNAVMTCAWAGQS